MQIDLDPYSLLTNYLLLVPIKLEEKKKNNTSSLLLVPIKLEEENPITHIVRQIKHLVWFVIYKVSNATVQLKIILIINKK